MSRALTNAEGAFSPDGKLIVFCSLREGWDPRRTLTPEELARREKDAAWFGDIYIMNADGSQPTRMKKGGTGNTWIIPSQRWSTWMSRNKTSCLRVLLR